MARRFIVRTLAEADIESAARWYDGERAGLGARFTRTMAARHEVRDPLVEMEPDLGIHVAVDGGTPEREVSAPGRLAAAHWAAIKCRNGCSTRAQ